MTLTFGSSSRALEAALRQILSSLFHVQASYITIFAKNSAAPPATRRFKQETKVQVTGNAVKLDVTVYFLFFDYFSLARNILGDLDGFSTTLTIGLAHLRLDTDLLGISAPYIKVTDPSRTQFPTKTPTVAPTFAPTSHPCDDDTHLCWRDTSSAGNHARCEATSGTEYYCHCLDGYAEVIEDPMTMTSIRMLPDGTTPPHKCAVTFAPTGVPTPLPTSHPTLAPSPSPTVSPTAPTHAPTPSPTKVLTHQPTPAPTPVPTTKPTPSPTSSPTVNPTSSPTSSPTAIPSFHPTAAPTPSPTTTPSPLPTITPTAAPTSAPTAAPTSIMSHPKCAHTHCRYSKVTGRAHKGAGMDKGYFGQTIVYAFHRLDPHFHCQYMPELDTCKCVCHESLKCSILHHQSGSTWGKQNMRQATNGTKVPFRNPRSKLFEHC